MNTYILALLLTTSTFLCAMEVPTKALEAHITALIERKKRQLDTDQEQLAAIKSRLEVYSTLDNDAHRIRLRQAELAKELDETQKQKLQEMRTLVDEFQQKKARIEQKYAALAQEARAQKDFVGQQQELAVRETRRLAQTDIQFLLNLNKVPVLPERPNTPISSPKAPPAFPFQGYSPKK